MTGDQCQIEGEKRERGVRSMEREKGCQIDGEKRGMSGLGREKRNVMLRESKGM